MGDKYIQVQNAMAPEAREVFLKNFFEANPRWRGAHVADVLAELDNVDANLDLIEPLFEAHKDEINKTTRPLISSVVNFIYWAHGREAVTWKRVSKLVARCK